MGVIYVLLLCTILNVLATKDLDFFRSELENTNILIGAHINAKLLSEIQLQKILLETSDLDTYNKGFEHTCRLLGLFMSMETTVPYATSADVTPPPDSTCVIRHGSVVLQSFKQFIHFIRFVNNENHGEKGQSILAFLQNY
ncbi:uncharacterized protein LOC126833609 [Adelges cooleyi]|uniref:uncharacterized protein LOC126833609 n=1 Tax=Adelges cooleyi TaxID=133065 RepID=UPI00217F4A4B|nr:uncharacterized protein LOC126833609 [Adelges cooleyi]